MKKPTMIALMGTIVIVALILFFTNFNVNINLNGASNGVSDQQVNQAVQGGQNDSMASHHSAGGAIDETLFNSLVGKPAPDFTLLTYNNQKITLNSLKGKNVILFFNEGLMCYPSCWNQMAAFGKNSDIANQAEVYSITVDQPSEWKQAIDKMPELVDATVLFDTDRQVSQKYGVLTTGSSMHKGQFPGHSYVVIDKEGVVRYVLDDPQMGIRNDQITAEVNKL